MISITKSSASPFGCVSKSYALTCDWEGCRHQPFIFTHRHNMRKGIEQARLAGWSFSMKRVARCPEHKGKRRS